MLKGKRVTLRAVEKYDAEFLFQIENDSNNWIFGSIYSPIPKFIFEQYVNIAHNDIYTNKQLRLMIDIKTADVVKTIGCVDLFEFDPQHLRAGIGILITKEWRLMGYGKETIEIVCSYAKNMLHLHQLWCNITESNTASIYLFEKCGFVRVGVKKDWVLFGQQWHNEIFYQKIL